MIRMRWRSGKCDLVAPGNEGMLLELLAGFGEVGSVMAAPALLPGQRAFRDQQGHGVDIPELITGTLGASNRLHGRGCQSFTGDPQTVPGANDAATLPGQAADGGFGQVWKDLIRSTGTFRSVM